MLHPQHPTGVEFIPYSFGCKGSRRLSARFTDKLRRCLLACSWGVEVIPSREMNSALDGCKFQDVKDVKFHRHGFCRALASRLRTNDCSGNSKGSPYQLNLWPYASSALYTVFVLGLDITVSITNALMVWDWQYNLISTLCCQYVYRLR